METEPKSTEQVKALIDFYKQWIFALWATVVVIAGGVSGLLTSSLDLLRVLLHIPPEL